MVDLEHINFSYDGQRGALQDISLHIQQGECVLLCGESGCGKTTITKLINGLIPYFTPGEHLTGMVSVGDKIVADTKIYELAKTVGSVFQNPKSQFFNLDSDSELAFGLENEGLPPMEIAERVKKTVHDLHIENLVHRGIFSMSGGEKQSLAFASVFAMQPKVFVLDEPSANLDMTSIEILREQIAKIKQNGHTVIIAEHRLYFLADLADRIVFLKAGKIEKIFNNSDFLALSEKERITLGLRTIRPTLLTLPDNDFYSDSDLIVKNLSYSYKGNVVLQNINFSASFGDVIGIVGHNGAGKSTFCECLCGLMKAQTGKILFEGKRLSPKNCRSKCAFVMQDVNHQLFLDSVWEECMLSTPHDEQGRTVGLLQRFGLLKYKDTHPMALSGGQKQRLAVVTAILSGKKVLIFDEPTSGLDYHNMREVSTLFKELSRTGHIVLVVSHDIEFLNETCTSKFQL